MCTLPGTLFFNYLQSRKSLIYFLKCPQQPGVERFKPGAQNSMWVFHGVAGIRPCKLLRAACRGAHSQEAGINSAAELGLRHSGVGCFSCCTKPLVPCQQLRATGTLLGTQFTEVLLPLGTDTTCHSQAPAGARHWHHHLQTQGAGQQPVEPLCVPTPALAPCYDRQFPYEEHGVVSRTQIHSLILFIYLFFYFRDRVIQRKREPGGRGTSSSASVSRCPEMAGAGPRQELGTQPRFPM